ncbi:MAG: hypothetical protein ACO1SV_09600 [Fimbriimonas sp.]
MNSRRVQIAMLTALFLGGVAFLSLPKNPPRPGELTDGTIYYTGPMRARGPGAKGYGYEDGTVAPSPVTR